MAFRLDDTRNRGLFARRDAADRARFEESLDPSPTKTPVLYVLFAENDQPRLSMQQLRHAS